MSRTSAEVLDELLAISPLGEAPTQAPDGMWATMLSPLASAISDCEATAEEFETEIDPETALALLPDYERVLGPDPCGRDSTGLSTAERQLLAYQRWRARGGQSIAYFEAVAESLGTSVTIQTFQTFVTGRSTTGQNLINTPRQFEWLVTLPQTLVTLFTTGASVTGDLLGDFEADPAVCPIQNDAPAHTLPVFSYTG
ncbi:MAG: DUF2313 domain-containing protein [Rhodospirillales bacterium]|nr:DUF2313 domain-containing protein [Rhodospirillales bacterium]